MTTGLAIQVSEEHDSAASTSVICMNCGKKPATRVRVDGTLQAASLSALADRTGTVALFERDILE